jgi:hypothetical protein
VTVRLTDDGVIVLEGDCPAEDAESMLRLLLLDPAAAVDWCGCDYAHTAIVQILLAARRVVHGPPRSLFLREWIAAAMSEVAG